MNRREFLLGTAAVGLTGCVSVRSALVPERIRFGACRSNPEDVALMKEIGYDFWEGGAGPTFDPTKDDAWWREQKDRLRAYALPLRSCNGFIPGHFRLTGPKADHGPALDYAETILRRADEMGVVAIVFGSGGARNVPGDICGPAAQRPDLERGTEQYKEFCAALAKRVSDLRTATVLIEPLRPRETNIVNYVWQAVQIARDVNSPRIKVLADLFHMMMGRESSESLRLAGNDLVHCHVASYGTREFPGAQPETVSCLKPYFQELDEMDYTGGISCECGWGKPEDLRKNLTTALNAMKGLFV